MQITIVMYQPKTSIFVLIANDNVISFKFYFSAIFEHSEIKRPSEHVRFINYIAQDECTFHGPYLFENADELT